MTLGTVQLGMQYGIANKRGCLDDASVNEILDLSWELGVRCFDTAPDYGLSEERIGNWLYNSKKDVKVISKLPKLSDADKKNISNSIESYIDTTLKNLKRDVLDGYLVHNPADLAHQEVIEALNFQLEKGKIKAFGVSVYNEEEIFSNIDVHGLSLLQAPVNIFYSDCYSSGGIKACAEKGLSVFARSIYSQGLIFVDVNALPDGLKEIAPTLKMLNELSIETKLSKNQLALLFVRDLSNIASVIIGVESTQQLRTAIQTLNMDKLEKEIMDELYNLGEGLARELTDPSQWKL